MTASPVSAHNSGSVELPVGWDSLGWEGKRGAVLNAAGFVCEICQSAEATEVDHIWPKAQGGLDARWNLRAACRPCNASKGQQIWADDLRRSPSLVMQGVSFQLSAAVEALRLAAHWQALLELMDAGVDVSAADRLAADNADLAPPLLNEAARVLEARVRSLIASTTTEPEPEVSA